MFRDSLQEALRSAAAPTLERIRQDREGLPRPLPEVLAYVEARLFDLKLNATRAKKAVNARSNTFPKLFRTHLETSLRAYIETARLEVADRLLRRGSFSIGQVSIAVGYVNHGTFLNAFKAWAGELPSEVGKKPNVPEIDYSIWRKVLRRELGQEAVIDVLGRLEGLYPEIPVQGDASRVAPDALPRLVVDPERYARHRAEEIWREIRDQPFEAQHHYLSRVEFRSEALFDLLRETSRQEGRRDRQRGIEIARLAMISLEGAEAFFGERIHDLRALGHAWVGNALRLAHDFLAADAAFERAHEEWEVPRRARDHLVEARIYDLKASLRIFQRDFEVALRLVERCRELFQLTDNRQGEIRSLIQLGTIYSYRGDPERSIAAHQAAKGLIDIRREPFLAFAVHCNLANDHAKLGRHSSAVENLERAREYCLLVGDPLALLKVQWVDAVVQLGLNNFREAENLLTLARAGYLAAGESSAFAVVSLDLAILYADAGRWAEVLKAASEAGPLLSVQQLHEETIATVSLLTQAIDAGEVTSTLLRQVREALGRDPLASRVC